MHCFCPINSECFHVNNPFLVASSLSCVWLFCDSMDCTGSSVHGIFRQEYWSGFLSPSPGDLLNPGLKPGSPALQANSLLSEPPGKPAILFSYISSAPKPSTSLMIASLVSVYWMNLRSTMTRNRQEKELWFLNKEKGRRYSGEEEITLNALYLPTFSIINGEGNGTPLQYSCLKNPMDGGPW